MAQETLGEFIGCQDPPRCAGGSLGIRLGLLQHLNYLGVHLIKSPGISESPPPISRAFTIEVMHNCSFLYGYLYPHPNSGFLDRPGSHGQRLPASSLPNSW